jgi:hypothetical protein
MRFLLKNKKQCAHIFGSAAEGFSFRPKSFQPQREYQARCGTFHLFLTRVEARMNFIPAKI